MILHLYTVYCPGILNWLPYYTDSVYTFLRICMMYSHTHQGYLEQLQFKMTLYVHYLIDYVVSYYYTPEYYYTQYVVLSLAQVNRQVQMSSHEDRDFDVELHLNETLQIKLSCLALLWARVRANLITQTAQPFLSKISLRFVEFPSALDER